jgi:hypothetical protein
MAKRAQIVSRGLVARCCLPARVRRSRLKGPAAVESPLDDGGDALACVFQVSLGRNGEQRLEGTSP